MTFEKFNPRANRLAAQQNQTAEADFDQNSPDEGANQGDGPTQDRQFSQLSQLSQAHTGKSHSEGGATYIYKTKHEHEHDDDVCERETTGGRSFGRIAEKPKSQVPPCESCESCESFGGEHQPTTSVPPSFEQAFWSWLVDGAPAESDETRAWRQRYRAAIDSLAPGDTLAYARLCAWAVLQRAWHRQHGQRPDPSICAACGETIIGPERVNVGEGAICHLRGDGDTAVACLIKYAADWRGAADVGLQTLGLIHPPPCISSSN
jgi:hypothetical protein